MGNTQKETFFNDCQRKPMKSSEKITIKFKKLHPNARMPEKKTSGAAAYDLYTSEDCFVKCVNRVIAKTGIAIELPKGYCAEVRPRSGFSAWGLVNMIVSPNELATWYGDVDADVLHGLIDSDYRGEIGIIVCNHDDEFIIPAGTRLAQLLILPVPETEFVEVDELGETERGEGGFGSTGGK